jgi:uncharacterized protein (DUF302 family)
MEASLDYGIRTVFDGSMQEAEAAVTEALKGVGFGVLTRIDVADTLKKKIDLDRPPYVILGACNPKYAAHAIDNEIEIGLLLPCNVIVYEDAQGRTIVSAIEPLRMFELVDRPDLRDVAEEVKALLQKAIDAIASKG